MPTLLQECLDKYAIPGVITFAENEHGLVSVAISTVTCKARLYLQGAHLAEWCPTDHEPVLFLSERSMFVPGKAIRGGVPVIFPWFGSRTANKYCDRSDGPSHGFARTSAWKITKAELNGDDVDLTLTLEPDDTSRSLGVDGLHATYQLTIGASLSLALTVENRSAKTAQFEEALHSYFMVGDASQIRIDGLRDAMFIDKTDELKRKQQSESALALSAETDRIYFGNTSDVEIFDPVLRRNIVVRKQHSKTTVLWNPWIDSTAKLSDMNPDGWLHMVCVETANAADDAITLTPGEKHTMSAQIEVKRHQSF